MPQTFKFQQSSQKQKISSDNEKKRQQEMNIRIQNALDAQGITVDDLKIILDGIEANEHVKKTIAVLMKNQNEVRVIDLIDLFVKYDNDSDLGKVLSILKQLDLDITLSDLFNYVSGNAGNTSSEGVKTLQSMENIPVIGLVLKFFKAVLNYVFVKPVEALFGINDDKNSNKDKKTISDIGKKPTNDKQDNKKIMGEEIDVDIRKIYVIHSQKYHVKSILKSYGINDNEYSSIKVTDFIGGKSGNLINASQKRMMKQGKQYNVGRNGKGLYYYSSSVDAKDIIMIEPKFKDASKNKTFMVEVDYMNEMNIAMKSGEKRKLKTLFVEPIEEYTHIQLLDMSGGLGGYIAKVTKDEAHVLVHDRVVLVPKEIAKNLDYFKDFKGNDQIRLTPVHKEKKLYLKPTMVRIFAAQ